MADAALSKLARARAEALARFAEWESTHPATMTPAAAVAAVGALYSLLPVSSRHRPVDPSGVACLQRALGHLSR
jgi:hypothetical protein